MLSEDGFEVDPTVLADVSHIFAEMLRLPRVHESTNFFEEGGHSLLVMRLVAKVKARCGVELSVRDIFDHSTVAGVAAVTTRKGAAKRHSSGGGT